MDMIAKSGQYLIILNRTYQSGPRHRVIDRGDCVVVLENIEAVNAYRGHVGLILAYDRVGDPDFVPPRGVQIKLGSLV